MNNCQNPSEHRPYSVEGQNEDKRPWPKLENDTKLFTQSDLDAAEQAGAIRQRDKDAQTVPARSAKPEGRPGWGENYQYQVAWDDGVKAVRDRIARNTIETGALDAAIREAVKVEREKWQYAVAAKLGLVFVGADVDAEAFWPAIKKFADESRTEGRAAGLEEAAGAIRVAYLDSVFKTDKPPMKPAQLVEHLVKTIEKLIGTDGAKALAERDERMRREGRVEAFEKCAMECQNHVQCEDSKSDVCLSHDSTGRKFAKLAEAERLAKPEEE